MDCLSLLSESKLIYASFMGIVIFLDDMPLFSFMAGLAVICPALKVDDLVIILRSVLEPDGATI